MPENHKFKQKNKSDNVLKTFYGKNNAYKPTSSKSMHSKTSFSRSKYDNNILQKSANETAITINSIKTVYDIEKPTKSHKNDLKSEKDVKKSSKFTGDLPLRKPVDLQIQEYEIKTNVKVIIQ